MGYCVSYNTGWSNFHSHSETISLSVPPSFNSHRNSLKQSKQKYCGACHAPVLPNSTLRSEKWGPNSFPLFAALKRAFSDSRSGRETWITVLHQILFRTDSYSGTVLASWLAIRLLLQPGKLIPFWVLSCEKGAQLNRVRIDSANKITIVEEQRPKSHLCERECAWIYLGKSGFVPNRNWIYRIPVCVGVCISERMCKVAKKV